MSKQQISTLSQWLVVVIVVLVTILLLQFLNPIGLTENGLIRLIKVTLTENGAGYKRSV